MSYILGILIGILVTPQGNCGQILLNKKASPTPGEWSSKGVYLSYGLGALDCPGKSPVAWIPSPDRKYKIQISPGGGTEDLILSVQNDSGTKLEGGERIDVPTLSEILWSHDSSAFAVTSSDGGWVGGWSVEVFLLKEGQIKKVDVSRLARVDAMHHYHCKEPASEEPNLAAVAWRPGWRQLVILAQAPPHSTCRDMGRLFGYIVSVPGGEIVKQYTESGFTTTWGMALGERLRPIH